MPVSDSSISKIINLIYPLDYSTIYKVVLDVADPTSVKSIDYVKKNLERI